MIGRNEGRRLEECLASLKQAGDAAIVYVDSGSTDGSVAHAQGVGAALVELDMNTPFTAARARNAGLKMLVQTWPELRHVHFVDGDCKVDPDWPASALLLMERQPKAAAVCGRLKERHPDASVFNRLCQFEWDGSGQFGEVRYCGGIALMRISALADVDGFNPAMIAGEEPELCVRLRSKGWSIWRVDGLMAIHDADMHRFGQWWLRVKRAGYAFAEGAAMHGAAPYFHYVEQRRRALVWGIAIPLAALLALLRFGPWALGLLAVYPLQMIRLSVRDAQRRRVRDRILRAVFLTIGRFAEAQGVLRYYWLQLKRERATLIEYK